MFDTDNIMPKEILLLDGQIDIILRALELYAFNLHNTWNVKTDDIKEELRNALIFHTYEGLLAQRHGNYRIAYDFAEEYRLEKERKRRKNYFARKKIA